jgi:hypothetical protein
MSNELRRKANDGRTAVLLLVQCLVRIDSVHKMYPSLIVYNQRRTRCLYAM